MRAICSPPRLRLRARWALVPVWSVLAVFALGAPTVPAFDIEAVLQQAFASSSFMRSAAVSLQAEGTRLAQALAERGVSISLNSRYQGVHIRDGSGSTDKATGSLFVEATQSLFDDGRVEARIAEAGSRIAAAAARLKLAEQQLLLGAVDSYIRILEGERLLELATASRRTLESELAAARDRFELGSGTRTAVAQAESRLAQADTALAQRVGELEVARSRYETAIGAPPPAELAPLIGLPDLPNSLVEALEAARQDHPELRALRADVQVAEHARRRIEALQAGEGLRVFGSAGATHDSDRGRQPGVRRTRPEMSAGLVFSVPLFDGGAKASRVLEAELMVEARRAQVQTSEAAIREEAVSAWESLILAESAMDSGRTRSEAAALALEGIRRAAQGGQASTLDILDGERELLDADTALVQAVYARQVAAFRLRAGIGSLSLEALGL